MFYLFLRDLGFDWWLGRLHCKLILIKAELKLFRDALEQTRTSSCLRRIANKFWRLVISRVDLRQFFNTVSLGWIVGKSNLSRRRLKKILTILKLRWQAALLNYPQQLRPAPPVLRIRQVLLNKHFWQRLGLAQQIIILTLIVHQVRRCGIPELRLGLVLQLQVPVELADGDEGAAPYAVFSFSILLRYLLILRHFKHQCVRQIIITISRSREHDRWVQRKNTITMLPRIGALVCLINLQLIIGAGIVAVADEIIERRCKRLRGLYLIIQFLSRHF